MSRILIGVGVLAILGGIAGELFLGDRVIFPLMMVIGFAVTFVGWGLSGPGPYVSSPETRRADSEEAQEEPILPGNWPGPS
jgi:hypothetical protein